MRILLLLVSIMAFHSVSSQEEALTAIIPISYQKSEMFTLHDDNYESVAHFSRKGGTKKIDVSGDTYYLKKRKVLVNKEGLEIAVYRGRSIFFSEKNVVVKEKRVRRGWTYSIDDETVLEVHFSFQKWNMKYYVTATFEERNEMTEDLLKMCLGRFDGRVIMYRRGDTEGVYQERQPMN